MARLAEGIDVSVPGRAGMGPGPWDPQVRIDGTKSIAEGEEANLTRVSMSRHTGTHMDAPLHFFEDDPGIETFPVDIALGRARVVLIEGEEPIDRGHVEELDLQSGERVVFRTTNSDRRWWEREINPKFVHVSVEAAELLGEVGVALVGVDDLSVVGYRTAGAEAHRSLIGAGVWAGEGLNLA